MPTIQFKGKSVIESYHYTVPHHRLEFDEKLSVLAKGEKAGLEGNLIIEGDNLLALKALLPTHAGRVKCVYIDPPYNTGNEGWIYNDNLTQPQFKKWIGQTVGKEGEDATRHDKWCCMMWPRLQLLKELLREDGSIWVSIDDNEVHRLRAMMDEVFGEENFLATISWQKVFAPKPAAKTFSTSCEFLVVYAKNRAKWDRLLLPRTAEQDARYENPDKDPRGAWASDNLLRNEHRDNSVYTVTSPKTGKEWTPEPGTSWRHPESEMLDLIESNQIWFGEDGNNMPRRKKFLLDVQQGRVPETFWPFDEVGHTQDAKRLVTQILGASENFFPFPKPVELVERVLRHGVRSGEIVLDATAGTGTTAHAVLKINASDGGNRRFVLLQQKYDSKENEADGVNIAEQVCRERVVRVMEGYEYSKKAKGGKKSVKVAGLGGSFTYARVDEPLFTEYKDLGEKLPSWEQLGRYVFYTETSGKVDEGKWDKESGYLGSTKVGSFRRRSWRGFSRGGR
jgi:adenine specific DNA methylase Mod